MTNRPYIVGNWKMNGGLAANTALLKRLADDTLLPRLRRERLQHAARRHLLIHALNVDDEAALIAEIQARYDAHNPGALKQLAAQKTKVLPFSKKSRPIDTWYEF